MFWKCFCYLLLLSTFGFIIGRILPKHWFDWTKYPYKMYEFEKEGRCYDKIGIHTWQNSLPDMSRIFKRLMPPKALKKRPDKERLVLMIQETCIAEWEHRLVSVLGFGCVCIWQGQGGIIFSFLFLIGNLPFILIQRYNRPRLIRLLSHVTKEIKKDNPIEVGENSACINTLS